MVLFTQHLTEGDNLLAMSSSVYNFKWYVVVGIQLYMIERILSGRLF